MSIRRQGLPFTHLPLRNHCKTGSLEVYQKQVIHPLFSIRHVVAVDTLIATRLRNWQLVCESWKETLVLLLVSVYFLPFFSHPSFLNPPSTSSTTTTRKCMIHSTYLSLPFNVHHHHSLLFFLSYGWASHTHDLLISSDPLRNRAKPTSQAWDFCGGIQSNQGCFGTRGILSKDVFGVLQHTNARGILCVTDGLKQYCRV